MGFIRNWCKRNVRTVKKLNITSFYCCGSPLQGTLSIYFKTQEKGSIQIVLKPEEIKILTDQITSCSKRLFLNDVLSKELLNGKKS